eukprot:7391741-Prymnesium_polylepis.2
MPGLGRLAAVRRRTHALASAGVPEGAGNVDGQEGKMVLKRLHYQVDRLGEVRAAECAAVRRVAIARPQEEEQHNGRSGAVTPED